MTRSSSLVPGKSNEKGEIELDEILLVAKRGRTINPFDAILGVLPGEIFDKGEAAWGHALAMKTHNYTANIPSLAKELPDLPRQKMRERERRINPRAQRKSDIDTVPSQPAYNPDKIKL